MKKQDSRHSKVSKLKIMDRKTLFTTKNLVIAFFTMICSHYTAPLKAQNLDSLYTVWEDPTQSDSIRLVAYKDYIWKGFLFSKQDTVEELVKDLHRMPKNTTILKHQL